MPQGEKIKYLEQNDFLFDVCSIKNVKCIYHSSVGENRTAQLYQMIKHLPDYPLNKDLLYDTWLIMSVVI